MYISKPLVQFNNFKGLYSKEEAGLVPSDPATGVYASEIQNVQCEDGTISFAKGYSRRDNGSTETTFAVADNTYVRNAYTYLTMAGENRELLWLNTGKLLFYNGGLNKYELLKDYSGASGASTDLGLTTYYYASTNVYERNVAYFGYKESQYVQSWNGAQTDIKSYTTNTITKHGTSTWLADGFTSTGTIVVNGITYTYTGGASSTTLTGVTPDPTVDSPAEHTGAVQSVNTNALTIAPYANIFFVYKGRLGVSSTLSTNIFLSKPGAPTDFTTAGNGGTITINVGDGYGPNVGVAVLDNDILLHKRHGIIRIALNETIQDSITTKIRPLLLRPDVGAQTQFAIAPGDSESYYISADKDIKLYKRTVEGTEDPTGITLSDDISPTLEGFELDNARTIFWKGSYYTALREGDENDTVIQYDTTRKTFYFYRKPVGCWFILGGDLYFGSSLDLKVFRWLDTYDDDGGSQSFLWRSGRLNLGEQFRKKQSNVFAVHLRMTANSTVSCQVDYNTLGTLHSVPFDVKGDGTSSDTGAYIVSGPIAASYGQNPYGIIPYGSSTKSENDEEFVEIVAFKKLPLRYTPYDFTVQFSGTGVGQRAKILAFGFNMDLKQELPKYAIIS